MSNRKVLITETHLENIADAIRLKNGSETTYKPGQMAAAIEAIPSAGTLQAKTVTPSASQQVVEPDSGYDGLSAVTVSGDADLVAGNIKKDVEIFGVTGNYEGSGGATLISKTITENGIYDPADDNADGYSGVTVNVSGTQKYERQIDDISDFTKLYSSSIPYGNYGEKVGIRLNETNETNIASLMSGGWNVSGACYYDAENQIGAYAGYSFGKAVRLTKAKIWIGRYSAQNIKLYVKVQYLDSSDEWNDVDTLEIPTSLDYPVNVFTVNLDKTIDMYGIRWIHKDAPNKSTNNNITFFGMTIYTETTYPETDDGKVVSNGELVSQTSRTVTNDGSYDTTTNNRVIVNTGGGTSYSSNVGNLFKYVIMSNKSGDKFIRNDRWFSRNTNEPIIVLSAAYCSGTTINYSGYAVISFSSTGVTGTSNYYGELGSSTKKTTAFGTDYWVQLMNGMYPPSVSNGKVRFEYNSSNVIEFVVNMTTLMIDADTKDTIGDPGLIAELEKLIDAMYEEYYAA